MNNDYLDNSIFFESSKKDEMQKFLNRIYGIMMQYPNLTLNDRIVYNQLRFGLLPNKEIDQKTGQGIGNRQFFDKWEKEFRNKKNVQAFCSEDFYYWFQFVNDFPDKGEYIKLYIPLDSTHLYRGVTELFSFMEKENIKHFSIVGQQASLDNVIVRLDKGDTKSLNKILEFVRNNKYINTGLNDCIPFIPTVNGIGIMNEHGNSYNMDISKYIADYIKYCISNSIKPRIDEFRNYVKINCYDNDLIETFENAFNYKAKFKDGKSKYTFEQKTYLLTDALKATYMKYGIEQARTAIVNAACDNNYNYFTNGGYELRTKLKNNVSPEDIIQIVKYSLPNFVHPKMMPQDLREKLRRFVSIMFEDSLTLSLDEAAIATMEKYDQNFLSSAISQYLATGNPGGFTRHGNNPEKGINYREQIVKIGRYELIDYMKRSLKLKGYDIEDEIDLDVPRIYANALANARYTSLSDSPQISR